MKIKWKNVIFDDFTEDEEGFVWSQLCKTCNERHTFDDNMVTDGGQGICGIKGCENESDYYVDDLLTEGVIVHDHQ